MCLKKIKIMCVHLGKEGGILAPRRRFGGSGELESCSNSSGGGEDYSPKGSEKLSLVQPVVDWPQYMYGYCKDSL